MSLSPDIIERIAAGRPALAPQSIDGEGRTERYLRRRRKGDAYPFGEGAIKDATVVQTLVAASFQLLSTHIFSTSICMD